MAYAVLNEDGSVTTNIESLQPNLKVTQSLPAAPVDSACGRAEAVAQTSTSTTTGD